MQMSLTAVVEEGGTRGRNVPVVVGKEIRIARGEKLDIDLDVVTSGGAPVELAGETVTLTVRQAPGTEKVFQLTATNLGRGTCRISLTSALSRAKDAGWYLYDVWLDRGSGQVDRIVPLRPFIILDTLLTG